jgi:acid phosphatase (class A)
MKYDFKLAIMLSLLFLLPSQSFAAPYFPGNAISPQLLEKPISPGSTEWKTGINKIKSMQKDANKDELKLAAEEVDIKPELMVLKLADNVTRQRHPVVFHLLDRVKETAEAASENSKQYWKTKRPYIADRSIKALVKSNRGFAYPSDHATVYYLMADVLGQLMPEKRKLFLKRADDMAHRHILVGMHFEQDITAGKQLARLIYDKLQKNSDYGDDLAAAQIDINK